MSKDTYLFEKYYEGFFVGPSESEEDFSLRVKYFTERSKEFDLPCKVRIWKKVCEVLGCKLDWVPLFFSNKNLPFWQGAATWIETSSSLPFPIVSMQIKKNFEKKPLSSKTQEILLHEGVHVLRMKFSEPRFEEILAYRSSLSRWRRFLGPLFQVSKESYVVVFAFLFSLLVQTLYLFFPLPEYLYWTSFFPYVLLGVYFCRLFVSQKVFAKCCNKLESLLPKEKVFVFALSLTDKEIASFAKCSLEEIKKYIAGNTTFRWEQIRSVYKEDL